MNKWKKILALKMLPKEDAEKVRSEGDTPENVSGLTKIYNSVKRVPTKGAFGKKGTNRKKQRANDAVQLAKLLQVKREEIERKFEDIDVG